MQKAIQSRGPRPNDLSGACGRGEEGVGASSKVWLRMLQFANCVTVQLHLEERQLNQLHVVTLNSHTLIQRQNLLGQEK